MVLLYFWRILPAFTFAVVIHLVSHSFFLFFGAKGIYEAVEGDFLDVHSLRLLNPYMVSVLHSPFILIEAELYSVFGIVAKFKCIMAVPASNVSKTTRQCVSNLC